MLKTVGNPSTRTGDQTIVNGNLVIGTAGKGIDFSANTHAAGMTSELLTWYEEGTWTPTVTAQTGSLTSYTSSGNYTRVGRQVTLVGTINITNAGTGTNGMIVAGLPFANTPVLGWGGSRDTAVNGFSITFSPTSSTQFTAYRYDNSTPLITGTEYKFCITYFVS